MNNLRFNELVGRYLQDTLTPVEGAELARLLEDAELRKQLEGLVDVQLADRSFDLEEPPALLHSRIQSWLQRHIDGRSAEVHRVHFLRRSFFRYAAAAVLILILGAGAWSLLRSPSRPLAAQAQRFHNDLRPGTV